MKKTALVTLVALSIQPAISQEFTKAEQGHLDVSKCYITCSDQIARMIPAFIVIMQNAEVNEYSVTYEGRTLWCYSTQIMMNAADTCQAGCRDLEAVYGPINSWAKTRYRSSFNNIKDDMVESGLWTNYKNYPDPNDSPFAFEQACDRFLGN